MPGEAQQAKDLLEVGVQEVLLLTLTRVRGGRAREDDQEPVPDLPFKKKADREGCQLSFSNNAYRN